MASLLLPGVSRAMTADGAMITNFAAATGYWGVAGPAYTSRYTVSYNATAGVIVSCPVVHITKMVTPTMLAVSQTATYTVCIINNALNASAFNLVVNDKMPDNMAWVTGLTNWSTGTAWSAPVFSSNGTTWGVAEPPAGQGSPWFLQWRIGPLGPNRSACVTFKMTVY
jgi:uncharacterized repeat protein (TIGR01451 family)